MKIMQTVLTRLTGIIFFTGLTGNTFMNNNTIEIKESSATIAIVASTARKGLL
jgi:hypothetical protein